MIARLLLFKIDNPLSVLQCADVAFIDGRVVAESLRCVATHQKNVAGDLLMFVCGRSSAAIAFISESVR